ncbi:MAG TPA: S9 family peptidase [Allosphingosinicella sp.]|nr:S9 family peptidase [Allosphingosinicella sp.]
MDRIRQFGWRGAWLSALFLSAAALAQPPAPPAPAPAPGPGATAAAPAERPIEQFAALPHFSAPRLSPDGTRLAVKMRAQGRQVLAIISLADPAARPAFLSGGDAIDINSWTWVNDNWLVVAVGTQDRSGDQDMYVTRLLGIDREARVMNRIGWVPSGQLASDILWVARDGSPRIVFAKQDGYYGAEFWPSVYEADVSTGRTRRVVSSRDGVLYWIADGQGNVRMGYGYNDDDGAERLIYRPDGTGDFRTIARANTRREERVPMPAMFLPGNNAAIAISDRDGFDAVYEMSLPDLALGRRLFAVEGYDIDAIHPTATGDRISGVSYTAERSTVHWREESMRRVQGSLDATFGEGRARIISWNRDRSKLLAFVGGPSQAGAYYLVDAAARSASRVAWLNEALQDRELAPVRTMRYRARDGVEIEAVLTLPPGREARNLPVIVMPHGGPSARDAESWDWITQFLADRGYLVVQPNYRGSSGYGTRFAELGRGEWGRKMQDDLDDALAWLAQQGLADRSRACIAGASYGGYAALRAAQRAPQAYRCAISYAGVSDLAALSRYDRNFFNSRGRRQWLSAQAPDFRAVSPLHHAAAFTIPVLLMHGDRDVLVPVSESRRMAERLRDAGRPHRYVEQRGADHHFSRADDRLQFLRELEAFLDQNNPV